MSISLDKVLSVHDEALMVQSRRMRLLSANLAHADTPNYKARDIDFREALREASVERVSMQKTNEAHLTGKSGGQYEAKYRVPHQPALDGNTVETEVEQAKFAENSMRYEATLMFLRRSVGGIRDALQRRGS